MSIVASLKKLIPPGGRNVHVYHSSAPTNMAPLLVGAPSSATSMARARDTKLHAAPGPRSSRSQYTLASCMWYTQVSSATSIAPVSLSTHMYNFAKHMAVAALHDVTRGELARAYSCEVYNVFSDYQFFERHNLRLVLEIRLVLKKKVNTI